MKQIKRQAINLWQKMKQTNIRPGILWSTVRSKVVDSVPLKTVLKITAGAKMIGAAIQ